MDLLVERRDHSFGERVVKQIYRCEGMPSSKKTYYHGGHPVNIQKFVQTRNPRDDSHYLFRIISVPFRSTATRPTDGSLAFVGHECCTLETCMYEQAWGPNDCNFISWNTAVCGYPHLTSKDKTVAWSDGSSIWGKDDEAPLADQIEKITTLPFHCPTRHRRGTCSARVGDTGLTRGFLLIHEPHLSFRRDTH